MNPVLLGALLRLAQQQTQKSFGTVNGQSSFEPYQGTDYGPAWTAHSTPPVLFPMLYDNAQSGMQSTGDAANTGTEGIGGMPSIDWTLGKPWFWGVDSGNQIPGEPHTYEDGSTEGEYPSSGRTPIGDFNHFTGGRVSSAPPGYDGSIPNFLEASLPSLAMALMRARANGTRQPQRLPIGRSDDPYFDEYQQVLSPHRQPINAPPPSMAGLFGSSTPPGPAPAHGLFGNSQAPAPSPLINRLANARRLF